MKIAPPRNEELVARLPFSISIDEHVPLSMGTRSIFFQAGAKRRFSMGRPKTFLQGGQKWQNFILSIETKKTTFFAKK